MYKQRTKYGIYFQVNKHGGGTYEFQELIGNGKPTTWILHAVS